MIKTKLANFIAVIGLTLVTTFGTTACGGNNDGQGNDSGNNNNYSMSVKVLVRDINFKTLSEKVYYGEDELCVSTDTGYITVNVPMSDDIELTDKLSLGVQTEKIAYIENYSQNAMEICIIKTDKPVEEFYMLSGKTVYAADEVTEDGVYIWSGETGAEGVELRIGDNVLPRGADVRNFDIKMVHKDSVITAYKEGCAFVNANWESYNNLCFADMLETVDSMVGITVNGEKISVKQYGGATFRLDNRKN